MSFDWYRVPKIHSKLSVSFTCYRTYLTVVIFWWFSFNEKSIKLIDNGCSIDIANMLWRSFVRYRTSLTRSPKKSGENSQNRCPVDIFIHMQWNVSISQHLLLTPTSRAHLSTKIYNSINKAIQLMPFICCKAFPVPNLILWCLRTSSS